MPAEFKSYNLVSDIAPDPSMHSLQIINDFVFYDRNRVDVLVQVFRRPLSLDLLTVADVVVSTNLPYESNS